MAEMVTPITVMSYYIILYIRRDAIDTSVHNNDDCDNNDVIVKYYDYYGLIL